MIYINPLKIPVLPKGWVPSHHTMCFFSSSISLVIVVQPCGESDQISDPTEEALLVSLVRGRVVPAWSSVETHSCFQNQGERATKTFQ